MLRAPDGIETALRGLSPIEPSRVFTRAEQAPALSHVEIAYDEARRDIGGPVCDEFDFRDMLLAALVAVASKSKRRQADLMAALHRARIEASLDRVMSTLETLEAAALVRDIVPLYDGGILVSVTNTGMDLLGRSAHFRFLQDVQPAGSHP